jgi:hypothetical protein
MLRNLVNLHGLVTPKGPKLMNLYDLATSMAPNLITYKVCEGGMERFRTGGPKGIERGRVGRRPQRRGGGEGGREGGPEEPAGRYEARKNRRT